MFWQFEAVILQPKLKNMRLSGNKTNSCRQVALFERNPICRLCYQICLDLAEDYGGVQFDLLRSLEVADALCERIMRHPWDLQGVDQYYHWIEGRLGCDRPTMACALATVCVTLQCINNPPAPVKRLARDLKGLIIGDANNLYSELLTAANRQAISIDADTYGDIPPVPKPQRELQELQRKCTEATTEIQTLKHQLKMEQEQQKHISYNVEQMTINMSGGTLVQHADIVQASGDVRVQHTAALSNSECSEAPQSVSAESILGIPAERDYKAVRVYIEERSRFDPDFKTFCEANSRVAICKRLSKEFGWDVDPYGLGRNINRNRKKKS